MRNVFAGPTLNFGIYPQFHADFHLFGPLVYPSHLIYRFLPLFASCLCLRCFSFRNLLREFPPISFGPDCAGKYRFLSTICAVKSPLPSKSFIWPAGLEDFNELSGFFLVDFDLTGYFSTFNLILYHSISSIHFISTIPDCASICSNKLLIFWDFEWIR